MGDSVAALISESLSSGQHLSDEGLGTILYAVCAAMDYPSDIARQSDRVPAETFRLLEHLAAANGDTVTLRVDTARSRKYSQSHEEPRLTANRDYECQS
jgi:hypothetical protein